MNKRRLTIATLVLFGAAAAAAVFMPARPALAIPVEVTANAPATLDKVVSNAKKKLLDSTNYAITQALLTAVNTAAQRVAAATATWVASGDIGQGPLIFSKEFGAWGSGLFLDTISDALNNFTKTAYGFGICQPLNPRVSLRIKLGIARTYIPAPTCSFSQFQKAVAGTYNNIESGKLLQNISASVEMGQSPLSFALSTQFGAAETAQNKKLDQAQQRLSSNGFKNLTAPISGDTKTPAQMIEHATVTQVDKANSTDQLTATTYLNKTDLLASVGANALRVFTSTLAGKLLDKYLKKGMITGADVVCKTPAGSAFDICKGAINEQLAAGSSDTGSGGAALASAYFASVFAPSVNVVDDYSPLSDMGTCPGADARGVWNCVLDQQFMSALTSQDNGYLSVRDAIAKGYLHGSWELIPKSDSRNNDFDCYTKGYCYTNLEKMRRMRIIPVGWEMATSADNTPGRKNITLQGAIDAFTDRNSPYYHLVDPDWILKVPVTQCRQMVNGQTLVTPDSNERAQVCVDAPSCISEDADGKCTGGFGYCTRERSVWKINATSCPAQFASCDTFSDPNGKSLSVLSNTVDASACNAGNAGCKPYAAVGSPSGWVAGAPSVYLNAKAPSCDVSGAGCRSLSQMKTASTANLIPNPSLEVPTADGAMAASWTKDWEAAGPSQYLRDGASAFDGLASYLNSSTLSLGGYHNLNGTVDVSVAPNQLYTFSFYAKTAAAGVQNGQVEIKLFDRPFIGTADEVCPAYAGIDSSPKPTCVQDLSLAAYQPTCTTTASSGISTCATAPGGDYGPKNPHGEIKVVFPLSGGYERYTVTFATPENAHYIGLYFPVLGAPYYLDAFQLEAGATATAFHVGGADNAGDTVDIKEPPAYLGCTGEGAADAGKGCDAYAKVCRQSEVGCDAYTPSDGGTAITAVTASGDVCSSQCVGYSTFKQEATRWSASQFPLYFIPSTAKSCQLSEVGCDEFTNLEAASAGGESKAYFTYIRSCRMPDPASDGTFFSWEGSDISGYQLKSYTLRVKADGNGSTLAVANTVDNYIQNPNASANPNGPVYLSGTNAAGCTKAIYAAKTNPDCRELIDPDSNIFYRLLSATVTSTGDCKVYRKTISSQADCTGTGGTWSAGTSSCDYFTYASQSVSCRKEVNGCRAYTGNQGNNTLTVVTTNFENNQTDGWSGGVVSNESTVVGEHSYAANTAVKPLVDASGNPLLKAGRSYMLTLWAKGGGNLNIYFQGRNIQPASGRPQYFADPFGQGTPLIKLTTEWQRYVLGPVIMGWTPDAGDQLVVNTDNGTGMTYLDNIELTETQDVFALVQGTWETPAVCDQTSAGQSLPQAQLGCSAYQNRDGATVNLKSFDHLCRAAAVGCEAFTDTQGTDTPFASFHNVVCSIGGAPDPNNTRDCMWNGKAVCSVAPNETDCRFNFDGSDTQLAAGNGFSYSIAPDTVAIPANTTVYLINDGSMTCDAAEVGCTALGDNDLNKLDTCSLAGGATGSARACPAGSSGAILKCYVAPGQTSCSYRIPWSLNGKTVYKMIDPNAIDDLLCTQDAVSCQAWTTGGGQKSYFKDPGSALCEYKDKGTLNGHEVSGWFKKGTDEPCDPTFVIAGTQLGIRKNLDPEFPPNAFAGVCKNEVAGCTEFTDHADTGATLPNGAKELPDGRPFYYINDNQVSDASAACNNQASQKQGCLALDRTDNPQKTIDTASTYAASEAKAFGPVAPVSDAGNDANIILKVTRDRVCSEWLECNTEQVVTDSATGRDVTRCLGLGSCLEKGADGRCIKWGTLDAVSQPLSNGVYTARDVTSSGNDYSGLSIPGLPPAFKFKQSGATPFTLNVSGNQVSQACKAYPELDSPFPKNDAPRGANTCESSVTGASGKDCECTYRKVTYGSTVKYYEPTAEAGTTKDFNPGEIAPAICTSGPYEGQGCSVYATGDRIGNYPDGPNLSCANGNDEGTCLAISKIDSFVGMNGYCLEHDDTLKTSANGKNVCLTWLPIDQPNGRDPNNLFASAGFLPKPGQEMYCAAPLKVCVPNECGNNYHTIKYEKMVPAVCTQLQYADIPVTGTNFSLPDGCFNDCDLGNVGNNWSVARTDCINRENDVCRPIVQNFCDQIGYDRNTYSDLGKAWCANTIAVTPECKGFKNDGTTQNTAFCTDAYNSCLDYLKPRLDFCKNMDTVIENNGTCLTNYGNHFECSENLQSAGKAFASTFCGRTTDGDFPSCRTDANGRRCNEAGYVYASKTQSYIATGPNAAKTIESCDTIGDTVTKFCGNGEACGMGESCVPVNDLTAKQTEYTQQETVEGVAVRIGDGKLFDANGQLLSLDLTDKTNKIVGYNTIPAPASHTYLTSTGLAGFPTLSSDSLVFKPSSNPDSITGQWLDFRGFDIPNFSPETKSSDPIIGSYPNDLVGMYYLGIRNGTAGSVSIDYDLASPSLLFASQVDRVTMRLQTWENNGVCRYGTSINGPLYSPDKGTGRCFEISEDGKKAYGFKAIARWPIHSDSGGNAAGSYGYNFYSAGDDWKISSTVSCTVGSDGVATDCQTSDIAPKDMILTSGNGWKAQASSGEGSVTISLRLSDSEPKRVIGVHLEATDNNNGGYFYLSNADFKMVGSGAGAICGEVAYAGSSNPLAEDSTSANGAYGVVKTSALTSDILTANDSTGKSVISKNSQCAPWGAFSIANPATIVTMASGKCEISKAAIFNGAGEILKVFAKALGIGLFNDTPETEHYFAYSNAPQKQKDNFTNASNSIIASGVTPTLEALKLNDQTTGLVAGLGSLRADLKFNASANVNQLPLKSMVIDWGDGDLFSSGNNNFFKNHKASCGDAGDTADNCDAKPFAYSHVYSCVRSNNTAPNDIDEIGVKKNDPVCIYFPSVKIADNWGVSATLGDILKVGVILPVQK